MKCIKYFFLIIACFTYKQTLFCDALIILDLKPYPILLDENRCEQMMENLKFPGKIAQYCMFGILDPNLAAGVFATYGGYLNVSDEMGLITFPYVHNKPKIKLVITSKITPILMAGNTVHHWEIDKGTPTQMYSIVRKKDEDNKISYWETTQLELPKNSRVPVDSIILLAKPDHIVVPLPEIDEKGQRIGVSLTQESPHLILPDIYVKKGNNLISHALYMLPLRHLFSPVRFEFKKEPQRFIKQLERKTT